MEHMRNNVRFHKELWSCELNQGPKIKGVEKGDFTNSLKIKFRRDFTAFERQQKALTDLPPTPTRHPLRKSSEDTTLVVQKFPVLIRVVSPVKRVSRDSSCNSESECYSVNNDSSSDNFDANNSAEDLDRQVKKILSESHCPLLLSDLSETDSSVKKTSLGKRIPLDTKKVNGKRKGDTSSGSAKRIFQSDNADDRKKKNIILAKIFDPKKVLKIGFTSDTKSTNDPNIECIRNGTYSENEVVSNTAKVGISTLAQPLNKKSNSKTLKRGFDEALNSCDMLYTRKYCDTNKRKERKFQNSFNIVSPSSATDTLFYKNERRNGSVTHQLKERKIHKESISLKSFNGKSQKKDREREKESADAQIYPPKDCLRMTGHCSQPTRTFPTFCEKYNKLSDEKRNQAFYLNEGLKLRQLASVESDVVKRIMLYLETVVYFILSINAMENSNTSNEEMTFQMYQETLNLTNFIISSKLERPQSKSFDYDKLIILSSRCQALLYFKVFNMKKLGIKENQKLIADYDKKFANSPSFTPDQLNQAYRGYATSSALSPTSSPEDVSVLESESSGFGNGNNFATRITEPCKLIPVAIYNKLQEQNQSYSYFLYSQDLWDQTDKMIINGSQIDFFTELDKIYGALTLHSSILKVVKYVEGAIERIKKNI